MRLFRFGGKVFTPQLFETFFQAGFECSSHRRRDGKRVDVIAATEHDRAAAADYRQLAALKLRTARDGLRWHLIERSPGQYDWSSFLPMLKAARDLDIQVIWDLLHYGWPDHIEPWRREFIDRFAAFAAASARLIRSETDAAPWFCPINEISFLSWAGGDKGYINPFGKGRGAEFKNQLVRASLAAIDAIRHVEKRARFIQAEPAIHIVADPARPRDRKAAEAFRLSQFEAWEMLTGNLAPELGGSPDHLDVVGVNYYWNNQWIHRGRTLIPGDPLYRPFRHILQEIHHRYKRALLVAETGREGDQRALWLRFIAEEVRAAFSAGVPVEGICIYPIIDYPGWDNERHCPCGLLGAAQPLSTRPVYEPLAAELRRQQAIFHGLFGEPRGRNLAGRVDTGRRTPNCQAQTTVAFEGLVDTDNAPDTQADTRTGAD